MPGLIDRMIINGELKRLQVRRWNLEKKKERIEKRKEELLNTMGDTENKNVAYRSKKAFELEDVEENSNEHEINLLEARIKALYDELKTK